MDFSLSDEQKMIRNMARAFADEVVAPRAADMDLAEGYPYDLLARMAELGMMGLPFPEQYGGSGGDWVGMHLCLEEIARADVPLAACLEVTTSVVGGELMVFGTHEQKKKWLTPIARGERIGAFGLTEPDAGSDASSLRTSAELCGNEWVLNGTKQFITNIGLENASLVLVAARIKEGADRKGIATFIAPKGSQGFTLGKRYQKIAWHSLATHEVILEDCVIPKSNLLGDPNRGLAQHLAALQTGRISLAAISVGLAQACMDAAKRYALERTQFGQSIYNFQAVQFKIVDMAIAIELARNQYLKAAWLKDHGRQHALEAATAKVFASEMAEKVASDAVQIHGGYGCMSEYPVSRFYKNSKLLQIVEGTSEIQRMIIARILADKQSFN